MTNIKLNLAANVSTTLATNSRQTDLMCILHNKDFKIFPLPYMSKVPKLKNWQNAYFKSEDEIRAYAPAHPYSNYGIIPNDDVVVVDVDNRNNGMENYKKLKRKGYFKKTFTVQTGSGGYHHYYKLPKDFSGQLAKNLEPAGYTGIDIKTKTGFLVAPESVHPDGGAYKFLVRENGYNLEEIHPKLLELATKKEVSVNEREKTQRADGEKIEKGSRNNRLTSYVGRLFYKGLSKDEVSTLAQWKNQNKCVPPLPQKEVAQIVKSISRYDNYTLGLQLIEKEI